MLGKLTRENNVDADDFRRVVAAGASEQQIKDALAVAFAFNVTDRLADVFDFAVDPARAGLPLTADWPLRLSPNQAGNHRGW